MTVRAATPRATTAAFALVATDLDGTLLRSDMTLSPRTHAALRAAQNGGAHHVVVTGRPAAGCRPVLETLGYRGMAVCGQGAQLYDADAGRLLLTVALDRDAARLAAERLTSASSEVHLGRVS